MICFNNIYKTYEKEVFSAFSLCLEEGKTTALLGPSGGGKTTLINMLLGFVKPDKGNITGTENKSFSVVFQEDRLLEGFTVEENVMVSCNDKALCSKVLEFLDISDASNFYISELSGGMKRRAAIARCLLKKADIYIFDEPFKGIDDALKSNIIYEIKNYLKGKTCIFITHDMDEAVNLSDFVKIIGKRPAEIIKEISVCDINNDFIEKFKNGSLN